MVPIFGFTPAHPPIKKYVWVRSKTLEEIKLAMVMAALISPSPIVTRHTDASEVQKALGNTGDAPAKVTS